MKHAISLLFLMGMSLMYIFCNINPEHHQNDTLIEIQHEDSIKIASIKKAGEVEVLLTESFLTLRPLISNMYKVSFYRTEKDSLRNYKAFFGIDTLYTHAYYHWENDSTIELILVNLETEEKSKVIFAGGSDSKTGRCTWGGYRDEKEQ